MTRMAEKIENLETFDAHPAGRALGTLLMLAAAAYGGLVFAGLHEPGPEPARVAETAPAEVSIARR